MTINEVKKLNEFIKHNNYFIKIKYATNDAYIIYLYYIIENNNYIIMSDYSKKVYDINLILKTIENFSNKSGIVNDLYNLILQFQEIEALSHIKIPEKSLAKLKI